MLERFIQFSKFRACLRYKKSEIIVTMVCAVLGFGCAYPPYGLFGRHIYDGPCSGVWGSMAFQCYLPDIIYSALVVGIPALIFRKRAHYVAWLSAFFFLTICVVLGIVAQNPLLFFRRAFYIPSIFGIWVGIWTVVVLAASINLLMRRLNKNR